LRFFRTPAFERAFARVVEMRFPEEPFEDFEALLLVVPEDDLREPEVEDPVEFLRTEEPEAAEASTGPDPMAPPIHPSPGRRRETDKTRPASAFPRRDRAGALAGERAIRTTEPPFKSEKIAAFRGSGHGLGPDPESGDPSKG
jgi:hypothetical protein